MSQKTKRRVADIGVLLVVLAGVVLAVFGGIMLAGWQARIDEHELYLRRVLDNYRVIVRALEAHDILVDRVAEDANVLRR